MNNIHIFNTDESGVDECFCERINIDILCMSHMELYIHNRNIVFQTAMYLTVAPFDLQMVWFCKHMRTFNKLTKLQLRS